MNAEAAFEKGMELFESAGKKKITKEAAEYFLEAARAGNPKAMYYYGLYCELHMIDFDKEETPAQFWLKQAADQGETEAQFQLGYYYERDLNRLLLQEGQEAVRSFLMNWYDSPEWIICRTNMEEYKYKALEYYKKAAEKGHVRACFNLGLIYERGIGPEGSNRDRKAAEELYQKAAEKGHPFALCRLAYCYLCGGETVEKDEKEAVRLYKQAAEKGSREAKFRLGLCYEKGLGVEKDEEKATEYYQAAGNHIPWWAKEARKKAEKK